jgi:hypothetical protein
VICFYRVKGAAQNLFIYKRTHAVVNEYKAILFFFTQAFFKRFEAVPDRSIAFMAACRDCTYLIKMIFLHDF